MTGIRLLADDLTGALDTAAELVPIAGRVPVFWPEVLPAILPSTCAIDSGTREKDRPDALVATARLAPALAEAVLSYKKVDSLLRGHTMGELAACLRSGAWDRCIVAPAFPYQKRVTVGGVQKVLHSGGAVSVVGDLIALLADAGVPAQRGVLDEPLRSGVSVFDAETDEDLARVAALGRDAPGAVLWCGSAGLAQALVGSRGIANPPPCLSGRVLGLFGSDHDVTTRQLQSCGEAWIRLSGNGADLGRVSALLENGDAVMASLELPMGISRAEAAGRIAAAFNGLVDGLRRPDTLLVAGGETLRGLCAALGTASLEVRGQFEPGLPHSLMRGGRWDGATVVSKSGAFGRPTLWRDLLSASGHLETPTPEQVRVRAEKVGA